MLLVPGACARVAEPGIRRGCFGGPPSLHGASRSACAVCIASNAHLTCDRTQTAWHV